MLIGSLLLGCSGSQGSEPTGEIEAASAAEFVDSIGVNVHLGYSDTAYGQVDQVVSRLSELGVRHIRDGLLVGRPDQYANLRTLAEEGIRATLILGDPQGRFGTGTLEEQIATLEAGVVAAVEAVEGPNEYDMAGDPSWAVALRDYQEQLYRSVAESPELDHLPVLGPSLVNPDSFRALGDLSAFLDYGNQHPYPGAHAPEGNLDQAFAFAATTSGSKPVMATETGYHNALNATEGQPPVSEQAAAAYVPRLFLEYFARGVERTFAYELLDEKPDPAGTDPEQHFGLLRNDFTPKPAFASLANLIELAGEADGECPATPLAIDVEASPDDVRRLLLQRCDGRYLLALWQPVSVWNVDARAELAPPSRPVAVRFHDGVESATVYRPAEGAEAVRAVRDPGSLELDVPADPLVVVLERP